MEDRFLKIEAFINGLLSEEEAAAFQREIEQDPELEREVKLHQLEWEAMHVLRKQNLRAKFMEWDEEVPFDESPEETHVVPFAAKQKKNKPIRRWVPYAIAASIVLLLGIGGSQFWSMNTQAYTHTSLFANKYDPQRIYNAGNKSTGGIATSFDTAYVYLENKQYAQAIRQFQRLTPGNSQYERAQLYIGHTYFQEGLDTQNRAQYDRAIQQYQQVASATQDANVRDDAEWYALMSLLLTDRVDESFQERLTHMAEDSNHNYQRQARNLEKDLNSIWYRGRH